MFRFQAQSFVFPVTRWWFYTSTRDLLLVLFAQSAFRPGRASQHNLFPGEFATCYSSCEYYHVPAMERALSLAQCWIVSRRLRNLSKNSQTKDWKESCAGMKLQRYPSSNFWSISAWLPDTIFKLIRSRAHLDPLYRCFSGWTVFSLPLIFPPCPREFTTIWAGAYHLTCPTPPSSSAWNCTLLYCRTFQNECLKPFPLQAKGAKFLPLYWDPHHLLWCWQTGLNFYLSFPLSKCSFTLAFHCWPMVQIEETLANSILVSAVSS